MSWHRAFDHPVPLPNGSPARTLRDAAAFIRRLPQAEREMPECYVAMQTLTAAAENHGPMMFAELCVNLAVRAKQSNPARVYPR